MKNRFDKPEIAVTGLGVVSPFGIGVDVFWNSLIANRSGVSEIKDDFFRRWSQVGARVPDFEARDYLDSKLIRKSCYFTQLALIAAEEALSDAGLISGRGESLKTGIDGNRIGTTYGSAFGGVRTLEESVYALASGKTDRVSPRLTSQVIPNAAAFSIDIRYGFRGPSMTYVTACAASANAIGECIPWFWRDEVDYVIAGGGDSMFSSAFLSGLREAGALARTGPDDLTAWSRPFDKNRTGMVMGEGAAFVVLETLENALRRGTHVYALLGGYGASVDAFHDTSPDPEGRGAILAMRRALNDAGMQTSDIDYINAHATATQAGDVAETKALKKLFGEELDNIPVSSIKGAVGHLLGGAGAIESVASIKALQTQMLPPTLHVSEQDVVSPKDIVANQSRQANIKTVMSNSFGFGGQNGILIWKSY